MNQIINPPALLILDVQKQKEQPATALFLYVLITGCKITINHTD